MTALQRYPVGLQDLREVINNGYVYVDKTRYAFELMTTYKYYFLARPRRFGKSLFVSTLDCIFTGQKELFKGLYIYDKWDFVEYPVIRISFSDIGYREIGLEIALHKKIQNIASQFGVILTNEPPSLMFKELIRVLQETYDQQVVILIDEYDKPIIDYLDKEYLHKAIENRGILKSFYSVLKDSDPYLKMVFITGVSKFTQVSIFSDLNNLFDI
ncbi:MAG TPA: AAA family ATPase, partial [Saprospiraceae bacterium]|nr:AAA family ATPase [Saprospiraceae bacterium]